MPGDQPGGSGWIKLNTNEHPEVLPGVVEAVRDALDERVRLYPDPDCTELREHLSERYGVPVEQVVVGNGSDELLGLVLRACVDSGERVVTPYPTYTLYRTLTQIHGAQMLELDSDEQFSLPVEELIRAGGRVTFITHPNAPTGRPVTLDQFAALCQGLAGVVVADEAYIDFGATTALPLLERYPNLVIMRTMSKGFGLAGLRVGYAFGSPEVIGGLYRVKDSYNVNRLSQAAAIAALGQYDLAMTTNHELAERRDALAATLEHEFGWRCWPSAANFLLVEPDSLPAVDIYTRLRQRRILVRHFGHRRLEDFLRISVGREADHRALVTALRELVG